MRLCTHYIRCPDENCKRRLAFFVFLVAVQFLFGTNVFAVTTDKYETNQEQIPKKYSTAPVIVDGIVLFVVRGVTAYPAQRRAKLIKDRIVVLAKDKKVEVTGLHIVEQQDETTIRYGEKDIKSVFDVDADYEGVLRSLLAKIHKDRIAEAIEAYRKDRSSRTLSINGTYTLVISLVFVAIIFAVLWVFRRLRAQFERRYKSRIEKLQERSLEIFHTEQIWSALSATLLAGRILLLLIFSYVYLQSVLSLFPWTRGFAEQLLNTVLDPVKTIAVATIDYFPKLVFLVVLFFLARFLLKALRILFGAIRVKRMQFTNFEPEWAWPTFRIIRLIVIIFAIVIAYPYIPGSSSDAFKGISLFVGLLFSLGSSSVISNIIAGYTMTYRRAFKVGDRVKIGETIGKVLEMRLLVTHLLSPKNEEVIIPNSTILNSEVINFSSLSSDIGLILNTTVGIGYEVPWRQVEAMLLLAAKQTPGLRTDRKAFVLQKSLSDYAVIYELNAYCAKVENMLSIYSQLHTNILDVFNEYGVQIMTPSYIADTEKLKIVPKDQWYAPPAKKPDATA